MKQSFKGWLVACFAAAGVAQGGDYIVSVDLLSPGEADFDGLPPDVLCIDIFADFPLSDRWTAAGVRGLTANGARLRYAPDPNDPNIPLLFSPGLEHRYSTCFSRPRSRTANARFTNAGAAAAGAYNPTGAVVIATTGEINIAYFQSPPESSGMYPDGYVARIALDVSAVPDAPIDIADWSAGPLSDAPPNATFVLRSEPRAGSSWPGTVHVTFDHPELYGIDWGVWFIPEPTALSLILSGAGLALFRRRNSG